MITDHIRAHPQAVRHASSATLVIVGVIALYNWVLAPQVGYLQALQKLEAVVGTVGEEKDRIQETLDAKVDQWRSLQQELAKLEEGIFTAQEAKAFVRCLLPLVEETGCVVVMADFAGKEETTRIEEPNVPLVMDVFHPSLVVSGSSDQVLALLQRLQDSRPRVWIDSCQCDFPDGGTGQAECSLVLALYVAEDRPKSGSP